MREFELIDKLGERIGEAGVEGGERVVIGVGEDAGGDRPARRDGDLGGHGGGGSALPPRDRVARGGGAQGAGDRAVRHRGDGAEAGEAYVALGIPADLHEAGGLALFTGIAEIAAESGTALAGGDVSAAPALTLAVTVVGHVDPASASWGAKCAAPGHVVWVTGELGRAAAAAAVERPPRAARRGDPLERPARCERRPYTRCRGRRRPRPGGGGREAMIDTSDALGADAGHIAESERG